MLQARAQLPILQQVLTADGVEPDSPSQSGDPTYAWVLQRFISESPVPVVNTSSFKVDISTHTQSWESENREPGALVNFFRFVPQAIVLARFFITTSTCQILVRFTVQTTCIRSVDS